MKLLLHTCCAPCMIHPMEDLRSKGFDVSGLFYNPNIHPVGEHEKRRQAVEYYSKETDTEVIYPEYFPSEFFWEVHEKDNDPQRCLICWRMRLKKTAQTAKDRGYGAFSTTLLVSPYQNYELLIKIGLTVAREEGVWFHYDDFRTGFREAHNKAKSKGIYCQNYCGCVYSHQERCKKSANTL